MSSNLLSSATLSCGNAITHCPKTVSTSRLVSVLSHFASSQDLEACARAGRGQTGVVLGLIVPTGTVSRGITFGWMRFADPSTGLGQAWRHPSVADHGESPVCSAGS